MKPAKRQKQLQRFPLGKNGKDFHFINIRREQQLLKNLETTECLTDLLLPHMLLFLRPMIDNACSSCFLNWYVTTYIRGWCLHNFKNVQSIYQFLSGIFRTLTIYDVFPCSHLYTSWIFHKSNVLCHHLPLK